MSGQDFTRWNRFGLQRLQYINGNAATYVEEIRQVFARLFPDKWHEQLEPPFDEDELREEVLGDERWIQHSKNEHLIAQYMAERGDLAWEIVRAFARSCHVLTEHINAHANEAFLRTATEWDSLRKLVATIDYHPVGPTSSMTYLAFEAQGRGIMSKGLQVRHRPISGAPPVIFETLEDLLVDERFNVMKVAGGERSEKRLIDLPDGSNINDSPWVTPPKAPVSVGDAAIIFEDVSFTIGEAAWVKQRTGRKVLLGHEGSAWEDFVAGEVRWKCSPRFKRKVWINGEAVRRTSVPHYLTAGSALAWRLRKTPAQLKENPWKYAEVVRADTFGLVLGLPFGIDEEPEESEDPEERTTNFSAQWPEWDKGDIEIRRATRLTGSYTVPPKPTIDDQAILGSKAHLADFDMGDAFSGAAQDSTEEIASPPSFDADIPMGKHFDFREVDSGNLETFIKWLFKAVGFAGSFPLTPDVLINIGAMIKVKDSRIPSTGQLVFEAFLDLFGGGGSDETTDFNGGTPTPALFRFWVEAETQEEADNWRGTEKPARPPLGKIFGELWYLPKKLEGAGNADNSLVDPEVLLARNSADKGWFFLGGKPSGLSPGDWVAARFVSQTNGPEWHAATIEAIRDSLDSTDDLGDETPEPEHRYFCPSACAVKLNFQHPSGQALVDKAELIEIHGDFRATTEPVGADFNDDRLDRIHLDPCPGHEIVGRTLIAIDNAGAVQKVRVDKITMNDRGGCDLTLVPSLGEPFKKGNLMLLGNVARAGHGERRPTLHLSGGHGVDRDDTLIIDDLEVSTVTDSRLAHGAREDLEVRIDGARWHQVPRLDHSDPTDRHFTTVHTEQGILRLQFGDGIHGRRLPAGRNNVRIAYRSGAGERGDLPPGSLEKLVEPHPLVTAVRQPLDSTGGSDGERPEHMRDRAPGSMLALGRAVSKGDFEQLAMQHRSVAQAVAAYHLGGAGRRDLVELVIVPASGIHAFDDTVMDELADYLTQRALPTVKVKIRLFDEPEEFDEGLCLSIDVFVDIQTFEAYRVCIAVRQAVASRFSIDQRPIGQSLHLSEVYEVVESVPGVEHSTCKFTNKAFEQIPNDRIVVIPTAVAYIKDENSVRCQSYEYLP